MSCLAACISPNTLVNFELSIRRLLSVLLFRVGGVIEYNLESRCRLDL